MGFYCGEGRITPASLPQCDSLGIPSPCAMQAPTYSHFYHILLRALRLLCNNAERVSTCYRKRYQRVRPDTMSTKRQNKASDEAKQEYTTLVNWTNLNQFLQDKTESAKYGLSKKDLNPSILAGYSQKTQRNWILVTLSGKQMFVANPPESVDIENDTFSTSIAISKDSEGNLHYALWLSESKAVSGEAAMRFLGLTY